MCLFLKFSKKEKPYNCTDCKFKTCDPSSLLRHRKRIHGYIPRSPVGYKVKEPNKHVPVSFILCGIDPADSSGSASIASHFSTFSSTEASTSAAASSSQQLSPSQSPLPSPKPTTLPPFPPSSSHFPSSHQSHVHSFPPTNSASFAESEVLSLSTPIASTSHHEFTPYPTVLSGTPPDSVYPESQLYHDHDILLFAPPTEDFTRPIDRPFTSAAAGLWDGSMVPSRESEIFGYQHPAEMVYDTKSSGEPPHELELNIPPPGASPDRDVDPSWPGIDTTGRLIGADGSPLPLNIQPPEAPSSSVRNFTTPQVVEQQHPIHVSPLDATHHHLPTGDFHRDDYDYLTHYEAYSAPSPLVMVPNPLDYSYSPFSPHGMFPDLHDVGVGLGYYDTMSLDGNNLNQNYHEFNTLSSHMSGFVDPFAAQDDALYTDLILAWN
jgi:hypothetical protein